MKIMAGRCGHLQHSSRCIHFRCASLPKWTTRHMPLSYFDPHPICDHMPAAETELHAGIYLLDGVVETRLTTLSPEIMLTASLVTYLH